MKDRQSIKNNMKIIFLVILLIFQLSCMLFQPQKKIIDSRHRTSEKTMLNYEDATRKYTIESIDDHFNIHIEIENPQYKIKLEKFKLTNIYKIANIEGMAIYSINLNKKGEIQALQKIKRAGLGLDEITDRIIEKIKIFPVSKMGENYRTNIILTISIVRKNML